jgi:ubiquinol-cytochrome c reductase cytochrome c1 subunit
MIKTRIIPALMAAAVTVSGVALPGAAHAAEGEQHIENVAFSYEGPFGTFDSHQLQRGFQVFHEVCAACHGLQYVSFRSLGWETGPAFPEEQVKAIAALYEVADEEGEPGDTRAAKPADNFPANTGAGAPDLSLMAKARAGFHGPYGLGLSQLFNGMGGGEYIYSILTEYTGEEIEEAGAVLYENKAFAGNKISMNPPLEDDLIEYVMHGGEGDGHGADAPEATVEQMAEDVSAFLMWAAEPHMTERKKSGLRNILMLVFLTVLLYFTNKALWASVKRKE